MYDNAHARTQLLYGAFTDNATSGVLCCGNHAPTFFSRHPAVWIVDHGLAVTAAKPIPVTFYTAVDPVTTKLLFAWHIEDSTPTKPVTTATSPTIEVATKHEWFQFGDASLDPPAAGQAPPDAKSAWERIAVKLPGDVCAGAKSATVQFGLFTNYLVVSTNPLRYQPYDFNKVPEWVVRCADVIQIPTGAPNLGGQPQRPAATASPATAIVDMISVFDARTGKLLLGFDDTAS